MTSAGSPAGRGQGASNASTAPRATARPAKPAGPRRVVAKCAHHVWHVDVTVVPILGTWLPWLPQAVANLLPFALHLVVVLDGFSRAPLARCVCRKEPAALQVCAALSDAVASAGRAPKHLVSDSGSQFTSAAYLAWCRTRQVKPRRNLST